MEGRAGPEAAGARGRPGCAVGAASAGWGTARGVARGAPPRPGSPPPLPGPQVWDMRRLERDVSFRSRLTYTGQPGAILAVAGVEDGQSAASASASGSLHVWRVDYTCKAGGGAPDKYTGAHAPPHARVPRPLPGRAPAILCRHQRPAPAYPAASAPASGSPLTPPLYPRLPRPGPQVSRCGVPCRPARAACWTCSSGGARRRSCCTRRSAAACMAWTSACSATPGWCPRRRSWGCCSRWGAAQDSRWRAAFARSQLLGLPPRAVG
jgi:hypothetical protein